MCTPCYEMAAEQMYQSLFWWAALVAKENPSCWHHFALYMAPHMFKQLLSEDPSLWWAWRTRRSHCWTTGASTSLWLLCPRSSCGTKASPSPCLVRKTVVNIWAIYCTKGRRLSLWLAKRKTWDQSLHKDRLHWRKACLQSIRCCCAALGSIVSQDRCRLPSSTSTNVRAASHNWFCASVCEALWFSCSAFVLGQLLLIRNS